MVMSLIDPLSKLVPAYYILVNGLMLCLLLFSYQVSHQEFRATIERSGEKFPHYKKLGFFLLAEPIGVVSGIFVW